MSERQYLKTLNAEIAKLNEIIDLKIIRDTNYRREAKRHKKLLAELRRNEARRSISKLVNWFFPVWR